MKIRKTAALSLGACMFLVNGMPVSAKSNTSMIDFISMNSGTVETTIDNVSDLIQTNIDAIEIATPQEEVSYTYVEQPIYYTVTETINEPISMSVDLTIYQQKEIVEVPADTSEKQAVYDTALLNYNIALAEYEAANQLIETTKEVEVEVIEETVDDQCNPVTETKAEIQTITETTYAGDVVTAKANLDAAKAALDAAAADFESAQNETVIVETETVSEAVYQSDEDDPFDGRIGDNLTWTLDDTGLLTISGTGDMYDLMGYTPWKLSDAKKLVIEEGVTSIGGGAFIGSDLIEVTLPNTLLRIEEYAFENVFDLKSVVIPDSVTYLGKMAFSNCEALETVTLSNNLETIGEAAFDSCISLTSITIPGSVETISQAALQNCTALTSVMILDGPVMIENYAFRDCTNLEEITIPASVFAIGDNSFSECSNVTFYVHANSEALAYAKNNGIPFVVIGEPVQDVRHSLSLDGNIGVNFYMSFDDSVFEDIFAKVELKVGDRTVSYNIDEAEAKDGYRKFTIDVTSAQMTTDIEANVIVNDENVYAETYTVKEYCDTQLADSSIDTKLRNLLEALLNYGGYAQKQFNVNIDNLANKDLENTDVSDVTAETLAKYAIDTLGKLEGLKHVGSTLTLNSLTSIKHYFKLEDGYSIDSFTFISDLGGLTPVHSSDLYYVELSNIKSKDLDTVHYLNTNNYIIYYSALSYAYTQVSKASSKDSLKDVCRALYKYNVAANEYFGD